MENYRVNDGYDGLELQLIAGSRVKYVFGFTDKEFYDPVFHITKIVLEDGTEIGVTGEHDIAYVESVSDEFDKKINEIDRLENPEDYKEKDENEE